MSRRRWGRIAPVLAVASSATLAHAQPGAPNPEKIELEEEPEPKKEAQPAPAPAPKPKPPAPKAVPAGPAKAAVEPVPKREPEKRAVPAPTLSGYLVPGFGYRYRAKAVPQDKHEYGFFGDAGLMAEAEPVERFKARLHILFEHSSFDAVSNVELIDRNGDGTPDDLSVQYESVSGVRVDEAIASFTPHERVEIVGGAMRIPFTMEQQSANTELMFPDRSAPNEVFLSGPDLGMAVLGNAGDGHVTGSLGAFNGDSLGLKLKNAVARGLTYSARVDVNPFGGFPFAEGSSKPGPFRLGVGAGVLYRAATLYDDRTGYQAINIKDARFSGSLRVAYQGLYFAIEYLRRVQTDDFSSRPQVDEGAYTNVSFFWRLFDTLAVEPIARLGYVAQDVSFDPRLIGWLDAGLNFYPRADLDPAGTVKLNVHYLGERRFTEEEDAHGVATSLQLLF